MTKIGRLNILKVKCIVITVSIDWLRYKSGHHGTVIFFCIAIIIPETICEPILKITLTFVRVEEESKYKGKLS